MVDIKIIEKCEEELQDDFKVLEKTALFNQEKVLNAFKKNKISLRHFCGTSGYGYGDEGRDALNGLFADVFNAESAVCSPFILSGTHALAVCLFGILRPDDKVLSVSGGVYDTLKDVIGGENGSLKSLGVKFDSVPLKGGKFDFKRIENKVESFKPTMIYIQRSRGYEWRNALSINDIKDCVDFVRKSGFDGCIMVDNCYGEFVEEREPTDVGADIVAGSLIKNPGGGIAPTGGYVAGKKKYVDMVLNRLVAPSIGGEIGSYPYGYQYFYQGLFLAPHTVLQAKKGAMLFSSVLTELGYKVSPAPHEIPRDIVTMIEFGDEKKLVSFIRTIQANSPIDSYVTAMPWEMPGYEDKVIMAAGCFVQGASIELSADAPIRPPFIGYLQGGITYEHCKIALKNLDL